MISGSLVLMDNSINSASPSVYVFSTWPRVLFFLSLSLSFSQFIILFKPLPFYFCSLPVFRKLWDTFVVFTILLYGIVPNLHKINMKAKNELKLTTIFSLSNAKTHFLKPWMPPLPLVTSAFLQYNMIGIYLSWDPITPHFKTQNSIWTHKIKYTHNRKERLRKQLMQSHAFKTFVYGCQVRLYRDDLFPNTHHSWHWALLEGKVKKAILSPKNGHSICCGIDHFCQFVLLFQIVSNAAAEKNMFLFTQNSLKVVINGTA